jgi:hypothetical protein
MTIEDDRDNSQPDFWCNSSSTTLYRLFLIILNISLTCSGRVSGWLSRLSSCKEPIKLQVSESWHLLAEFHNSTDLDPVDR